MFKQQLRSQYLDRRGALAAADKTDLNSKIHTKFMEWMDPKMQVVHIFLPIEEKNEIDTWPIIEDLWQKRCVVVVPVMDFGTNILGTKYLEPASKIVQNKWGVPEPESAEFVDNQKIDVLVTPLLAFDLSGYRVGYGKGYYDRFLQSFQEIPTVVGLSFFPPVSKIADANSRDVRMNFCITPEAVFRF